MANDTGIPKLQRAFYTLGILVFVVAILYWAQVVLVPVALAVLLAFILSPPTDWLEARGLNRVVSVLLVSLLAFLFLGGVLWVVAFEVRELLTRLPQHQHTLSTKFTWLHDLSEQVDKLQEAAKAPNAPAGGAGPDTSERPAKVQVQGPGSSILSWVPGLARPLLEVLGHGLLILVLMIFMLIQRESARDRLLRLAGRGHLTTTTKALTDAAERISRYLLFQLGTNSVVGTGVAVGLYFLGVPYAPLWGLTTVALRFIPYVGVWLAALLPFILSVIIFPGWTQPLLVLALFLVLELVVANAVEPLVFGHGTGVSPMALLVAAVFWASLWGPVGLLMSTPLTVCLIVLGKHVRSFRFLSVLLGDEPALELSARYYQRLLARDQDEATDLVREYLETHAAEAVYDEVFVPALVLAKRDRGLRELAEEDEQYILHATRDILHYVVPRQEPAPAANGPTGSGAADGRPRAWLVGCPAQGAEDELALRLFQRLVRPTGWEVRVVSPRWSIAKVVALAVRQRPPVVCVAALPPGGLAQMGNLCRQLRAQLPELKILVGRWGPKDDDEQARQALRSAKADGVATSLAETRDQLLAFTRTDIPAPAAGTPPTAAPASAPGPPNKGAAAELVRGPADG